MDGELETGWGCGLVMDRAIERGSGCMSHPVLSTKSNAKYMYVRINLHTYSVIINYCRYIVKGIKLIYYRVDSESYAENIA